MIFTDKIKLGLYGFGNVAKGVLFAAKGSSDLAVTSVFTKRNPNEVSLPFKDINVYSKDELLNHKNDIDVLVMCGGSFKDLPKETPYAARYFNTVDSFDTHSKIKEHFENNKSYRQIAIDLMLTEPGIVSDWVAMYKEKGEESIKDTCSREAYKHHDDKVLEKEYKKLLEDLERTKAENEYLKKSFPLVLERSKQSRKK